MYVNKVYFCVHICSLNLQIRNRLQHLVMEDHYLIIILNRRVKLSQDLLELVG